MIGVECLSSCWQGGQAQHKGHDPEHLDASRDGVHRLLKTHASSLARSPSEPRTTGTAVTPGVGFRQIRRLVLYVHTVRLSNVCAAQVSGRVQPAPDNPSGDAWWTATRTTTNLAGQPITKTTGNRLLGAGPCCRCCSGQVGRPASTLLSGRVAPGGMTSRMTCPPFRPAPVDAIGGARPSRCLRTAAPLTPPNRAPAAVLAPA
jgi:hypothetical protein